MLTQGDATPFIKFRDASNLTPLFEISLQDCLLATEKGLRYRFFDFSDFNAVEYEFFEVNSDIIIFYKKVYLKVSVSAGRKRGPELDHAKKVYSHVRAT